MAFSVRPVREVMTPRTDIVAIDEHAAAGRHPRGLRPERLQPDPGVPRDARRHHRHAARLRPVPAQARRSAAGAAGRRDARPAGAAATCCSTCSASGATSRSCSTSSAARWASPRSRICSRSWSARSSTSTTTRSAPRPAAGPAVFETDGNIPPEAIEERFGVSLPAGPLDHGRRAAGRVGRPDSQRGRAVQRPRASSSTSCRPRPPASSGC